MAGTERVLRAMASADEDRILRVWTPVILRTILMTAAAILVVGLVVMTRQTPGYYVDHFHQLQTQGIHRQHENWSELTAMVRRGEPRAILTIGLMALTLVPLARVAFCFLLFVRERDTTYVFFTAYVLAGLIIGVVLGRVG